MTSVGDDTPASMTIREIRDSDQPDGVRLREALWPGSLSDHDEETRKYFALRSTALLVFVAEAEGRIDGFLESIVVNT